MAGLESRAAWDLDDPVMLAVLQALLAVVLYLGLQGALILPLDFGQEGGDMVTWLWPTLLGAFHRHGMTSA